MDLCGEQVCGKVYLWHRGDALKCADSFPVIYPGRPGEKPLQVFSSSCNRLVGLCIPALALKRFGLHRYAPIMSLEENILQAGTDND